MKSRISHIWSFLNDPHFVNCSGRNAKHLVSAKMGFLVLIFFSMLFSANATTWYVDSSVSTSGNGTSWASAWKNLSNITGVSAGDTVYISGGANGSSQTYSMSGTWTPAGGSAGNPITYQIGQDSAHNGTAIFSGSGTFFGAVNNVVVSGDAGDGNMHFQTSGFSVIIWVQSTLSNLRLGYINFGQMAGSGGSSGDVMYLSAVNGFEFDHNYVYLSDSAANSFAYFVFKGTTWDQNLIHDNTIYLPNKNNGYGADGIESGGASGFSIYNNSIIGYYLSSYSGSQHQDAFQDTGGSSYIKVYNNTFVNMGNSSVFLDGYYGGFSNVQIYNNLMYMTVSVTGSWYPRGMDIIADNAAVKGPLAFSNIVAANNTVANYSTLYAISFYPPATGVGATYTGCIAANNIAYDCGSSFVFNSQSGFTAADNVSASGNAGFANTSAYDFHLTSSATQFVGKGANESSYFTTDKDGNTRVPTGAWDVGAYAYTTNSSGTLTPPSVAPQGLQIESSSP
jgi:hypothetical protein